MVESLTGPAGSHPETSIQKRAKVGGPGSGGRSVCKGAPIVIGCLVVPRTSNSFWQETPSASLVSGTANAPTCNPISR